MNKNIKKLEIASFIGSCLIPTFEYYFTDGDFRTKFYKIVDEAEQNYKEDLDND